MQVNLTPEFTMRITSLGKLTVQRGNERCAVTGDLSGTFSSCCGDVEILAKLRTLHDAALISSEKATKHTRGNWERTIAQLRGAIVAVQGDEQAWADETLRIAGASARAAATWHKGVKAALHTLYVYARTPGQAAEDLLVTLRIIERDQREAA
jgi:hypothetical protein